MILFRSLGRRHLDGHKELSKHSDIITLSSKAGAKVYYPTFSPNNKPMNVLVKPGDKVKVGQKIMERTDFYVPIYSSVSGTVLADENVLSAQIGRQIKHLVIENDGLDELAEPLKTVNLDSSKEEIFAAIKEAGLVGMGGAGFPTYIKYQNPKGIDTLLVNGVECEPFITTDFITMSKEVEFLLTGCELLMKASGASKAIIAIKVHKDEQRDAIKAQLDAHPHISLVEVPDVYPMGWERALIKHVIKKEYNRLPAEAGVVINNGQTVLSLGKVLTTGRTVADRTVTVSGDAVKHPANVVCKIGTLASELIEACGGYVGGQTTLIPGGPMTGKAQTSDKFPIIMQMGALTILKYKEYKEEPCLRCGSCTAHCPAGLQPVEIRNAHKLKDTERMIKLNVMDCVSCGLCSYSCPSHIELTKTMDMAKTVVRFKLTQQAALEAAKKAAAEEKAKAAENK
jgi:electron transport complex protein RnfC